jgi:hypothetical protein
LWQVVVQTWFEARDGYLMRMRGSIPDTPVIDVRAIEPSPQTDLGRWAERRIFLVECKSPLCDTPTRWEAPLAGQPQEEDTSNNLNLSAKRPVGATAIGKKVRFYKYDEEAAEGQQPELIPLHENPMDMSNDYGVAQVENMMDYIKATMGSPDLESFTPEE